MNMRTFQAPTMREALAQVKRELGTDAMVLSTREIRSGGIEVTAAVEPREPRPVTSQVRSLAAHAAPAPAAAQMGALTSELDRVLEPIKVELRALRRAVKSTTLDESTARELAALREAVQKGQVAQPATQVVGAEEDKVIAPSLRDVAAGARIAAASEKRIIALVGPTGVGKTTSIAKLAAREALIEKKRVGLITLDSYRIGGEEQIRAYADLIGVPLELCPDASRLPHALNKLRDAQRIFIDTSGRSPADIAGIRELEEAFGNIGDLEVHLAVPGTSTARQIDVVFGRHRNIGIDRLLFTKLDECEEMGELVRAPARLGRPVTWMTNGQRVPEDIEDATTDRLLQLAERARWEAAS
jgi:flagellar biosynthesis protein FlhF